MDARRIIYIGNLGTKKWSVGNKNPIRNCKAQIPKAFIQFIVCKKYTAIKFSAHPLFGKHQFPDFRGDFLGDLVELSASLRPASLEFSSSISKSL